MKDQISALMDDEVTLYEAEYLYTALKADGESRECWMTYHLIGDVMRGSPVLSSDLRQRIMQELEKAPAVLAPNADMSLTAQRERKIPVLWSVAASLAAVAFVGMIVHQQQSQPADEITPLEIAQSLPTEYLHAHQSVAPSSAAYYIQAAAYSERSK